VPLKGNGVRGRGPISKGKERLDRLLVTRKLVASREEAQRLIMAGQVFVNGQKAEKPGRQVALQATLQVRERSPYVSRGGLKLAAALDAFSLDVTGVVAADIGASTGGFTDCLLQRGAALVYAVDVGYGQLAWKLRRDPRVRLLERTNVRYLEKLPDQVDVAVIDVSFISLELVLPQVVRYVRPGGWVVALIKPQFEAGRRDVGKGGIVRDMAVRRRVVETVLARAETLSLALRGVIRSPIHGAKGNVEFLAAWCTACETEMTPDAAIRDLFKSSQ